MYEKIKKANNMMGLMRSFIYVDEEMFLTLYKALVRPHLEYANVIKIKDITAIERWATKYLPALKDLSYEERLRKLKLPILRYQRLRGDMSETYKLMIGKYDYAIDSRLHAKQHDSSSSLATRGHHLKLYKEQRRTYITISSVFKSQATGTVSLIMLFRHQTPRYLKAD